MRGGGMIPSGSGGDGEFVVEVSPGIEAVFASVPLVEAAWISGDGTSTSSVSGLRRSSFRAGE